MRFAFSKIATSAALVSCIFFGNVAQAEAAKYTIDPTHTFVTFSILHFGTSTNRGRFDKKIGTVTYDKKAETGTIDLTIDTTSISTGTPAFDKHLQSADLLNTAEFPKAHFVADDFKFNEGKLASITGKLTLLGKTESVTLNADNFNCYNNPMLAGREVCGGDFEAHIDRTAFGMNFGLAFGVPKEVCLTIQVEAIKQE